MRVIRDGWLPWLVHEPPAPSILSGGLLPKWPPCALGSTQSWRLHMQGRTADGHAMQCAWACSSGCLMCYVPQV